MTFADVPAARSPAELLVLTSAAEVLAATGHDPYARATLRPGLDISGWSAGGATVWLGLEPEEQVPYLSALGPPAAAASLLAAVAVELPPQPRVTLPQKARALLAPGLALTGGADWEFRWTASPPPRQPGELRARWLAGSDGGAGAQDLQSLLEVASPSAWRKPGDPAVRGWAVLPADGLPGAAPPRPGEALDACAADTSPGTGVGHLSSVATGPQRRGHGLGAAVTAWLTRRLLAEHDVVTLALYADNRPARRLYVRLGFHGVHAFSSGRLEDARGG